MSNLDGYGNMIEEPLTMADIPELGHLLRLQTVSNLLIDDLVKEGSALRAVMERIKSEADKSVDDFIYSDLTTPEGIEKAKGFQNKIHRHIDLMEAVGGIIDDGGEASTIIRNASIAEQVDEANPNEEPNE